MRSFDDCVDVLKDASLNKNRAIVLNLKSMTRVVVPIVIDCMEKRIAADFRRPARGVVDVVVLKGNGLRKVRFTLYGWSVLKRQILGWKKEGSLHR